MRKIAIIGNAGGGKSTLARSLARTQGIPHHEIDAFLWSSDWTARALTEVLAAQNAILAQPCWILDGFGPWESVEPRLRAADTIFFLDLPLWMHFWLAHERQSAWRQGRLDNPPGGHRSPPSSRALFQTIGTIADTWLPRLRPMIDRFEKQGKSVQRITDLEQLRSWTERPEPAPAPD